MVYNLSSISENSTGIVSIAQGVNNEILNGLLGILLLIGIVAVFFIGFFYSSRNVRSAYVGSMFITFIISIIFVAISIAPPQAIFICLILLALALALPD